MYFCIIHPPPWTAPSALPLLPPHMLAVKQVVKGCEVGPYRSPSPPGCPICRFNCIEVTSLGAALWTLLFWINIIFIIVINKCINYKLVMSHLQFNTDENNISIEQRSRKNGNSCTLQEYTACGYPSNLKNLVLHL